MRWHVWHRAPGTVVWQHEEHTSQAEAEESLTYWATVGHSAQIKKGSEDE